MFHIRNYCWATKCLHFEPVAAVSLRPCGPALYTKHKSHISLFTTRRNRHQRAQSTSIHQLWSQYFLAGEEASGAGDRTCSAFVWWHEAGQGRQAGKET